MDLPEPSCHTPEQLVGIGFRGWLSGYKYQDIACWEEVWKTYITALGPQEAKRAVSDLSSWVRSIKQTACRPITTLPLSCCHFCEDERTAVSIIAACQHDHCPALQICAQTLLGSSDVEAMLDEASDFAGLLTDVGQHLKLLSESSTLCTGLCRVQTFTRH